MQPITEETKKKVVKLNIQDERTVFSLAAEYGICTATVSNWIRANREECQTNDAAKFDYELVRDSTTQTRTCKSKERKQLCFYK